MHHRARVTARLTAVLTTAALALSGPGAVAASASTAASDIRDSFGPSWIIGSRTTSTTSTADQLAAGTDEQAPPASVSSPWPKGRLADLEETGGVLDYLLGDTPSEAAEADIPGIVQRLYIESAAKCEGLPWAVLAGMGEVASDHGRELGTRRERVTGPLRIPSAVWRQHGLDADGDGTARRTVAEDAFSSTATYLCEAAADEDGALDLDLLREAIARFYGDADVVEPVLTSAVAYVDPERTVADDLAAAPTDDAPPPATAPVAAEESSAAVAVGDVEALIDHPNITWTERERSDIRAGLIDGRVTGLLAALARDHTLTVVVLKSGHSRYIAGTQKESHHYHGRAVDITHIDGEKVSATSKKAYALALWLDALPASLRPAEVGSPFANLEPRPGFFSDSMHTGHLHIGWRNR